MKTKWDKTHSFYASLVCSFLFLSRKLTSELSLVGVEPLNDVFTMQTSIVKIVLSYYFEQSPKPI